MPSRYYSRNFKPGKYYHLFNRGAYKKALFKNKEDFDTFIEIMIYYLKFPTGEPKSILKRKEERKRKTSKVRNLVEITSSFSVACYCLMPNHYHFMIKQESKPTLKNSVINFMRRVSITYAMYFTYKYDHSGNIFQGKYKNVPVDDTEQLLYLTKYIHLNPKPILKLNQNLAGYAYSSYQDYLSRNKQRYNLLVNGNEVLLRFKKNYPKLSYKSFVEKTPQKQSLIEKISLD